MKIFLGLFLVLSVLLQAAPNFKRRIDAITYRSQGGCTVGLIKLTDGSVWKWIPDIYGENLLRKWSEGDEILIQTVNHPGFVLQNLSQPNYTPTVALSFNSYLIFPSIKSYEDDKIELSDGSKWSLIFDFNKRTLYHWSIGDRVVQVKGIHDNFELINLDIPYENRCQIERCIEVCPYPPNSGGS